MNVIVLGSINMDVVTTVAELPKPGETVSALEQRLHPGGKGANQAIAAARSGASTSILGAVGEDDYGTLLTDNLKISGVGTDRIVTLTGASTGQAMITVSQAGENTILVLSGANHEYTFPTDDISTDPTALTSSIRLTQFEMPLAEIKRFFRASNSESGLRILNPAPAIPQGRHLFDLSDIIIVNETELATYAGVALSKTQTREGVAALARSLMTRETQWIVVTLGAKGAIAINADHEIVVDGSPVDVIDTTGAGDCFCGALAAQLCAGSPVREALGFANAAASIAVTRHGASSSMPTYQEVVEKGY